MDFNSLGTGSTFYIHTKREGQKPLLEVGVVKEKAVQPPQYQLQVMPNAMNGMGTQPLLRFTVTVGTSERVLSDIPANLEIAAKGNETYSGSPQAMMQAIDAMMQVSRGELSREAYNKMVIDESERHMEVLNPRYAEEKKRDRTIQELVEHRKETDSKLDQILRFMKDLASPSKK